MAVQPPKVMVDLGVCEPDEVWLIRKALYGFNTSPSYWAIYRDQVLEELTWEDNNVAYHLIQTKERNLWRIVEKETQVVRGLLLVYVDDLLVMGDAVARPGLLKCIQSRWKTSTPETVDDQGWVRFCGYELKSHEGGLLL